MLWIITEDSQSGYQFWKSVAMAYNLYKPAYNNIEFAKSARGMPNTVERCMVKLADTKRYGKNNIIFCALDRVPSAFSIIRRIKTLSKKHKIPVEFTLAYSFESMFASYDDWNATCPTVIQNPQNPQEQVIVDMMHYLRNCICDEVEIELTPQTPLHIRYCTYVKSMSPSMTMATPETIITEVLNMYTGRGIFSVGRKDITKCWLYSCGGVAYLVCPYSNSTDVSIGKRDYFWQLCLRDWTSGHHGSCLQFHTFKEKIAHFAQHSLFGLELDNLFHFIEKNRSNNNVNNLRHRRGAGIKGSSGRRKIKK